MCNIFSWFYKRKRRDVIKPNKIREGSILKIYPASRSHVRKPYLVKVVFVCDEYFNTRMIDETGDTRTFIFDSERWNTYHHNRFKIIKL